MTRDEANAIYDILVRECGADDGNDRRWSRRDHFVCEFTRERPTDEYRFMGALGFGGKFYSRDMRVSCYREDETPKRTKMIERANAALRALVSLEPPRAKEQEPTPGESEEHVIEFRSGTFFQSLDTDNGGPAETARRFASRDEADAFIDTHAWIAFNGGMPYQLERALRGAKQP